MLVKIFWLRNQPCCFPQAPWASLAAPACLMISRACSVFQPCTGLCRNHSQSRGDYQQLDFPFPWTVPGWAPSLSQGSRCRPRELQPSPALGHPWACGHSTLGFCTQKAPCAELLHHSCCWAVLALLSKGRIHQGRDLLPLPMEAKGAELGLFTRTQQTHMLNVVHWEQSLLSK